MDVAKVFRCLKTQNDYNFQVKLSECLKANPQNFGASIYN